MIILIVTDQLQQEIPFLYQNKYQINMIILIVTDQLQQEIPMDF